MAETHCIESDIEYARTMTTNNDAARTVRACDVPNQSTITYTYRRMVNARDYDAEPIIETVVVTGTIDRPVGMSRLGNQGFRVVGPDGTTVGHVGRYEFVTVIV